MFHELVKNHRLLFYLLLILLPTQLSNHFWPDFSLVQGIRIDYLSPTVFFTDIIIAVVLIFWILETSSVKKIPNVSIFMILILCSLTLNILVAVIPLLSFFKALTLLKLLALGYYVYKTKPNERIVRYCLLFAVFYSSIIAWVQFSQQTSIDGMLWWIGERTFSRSTPGIATAMLNGSLFLRPYATFPHPNVLAGFIVALFPVAITTSFPKPWGKFITIPLLALMGATLIITYSRSAWLVALVLFFFMSIKSKFGIKKNRAFLVIIVCGVLLALPSIAQRLHSLTTTDQQSISRRITLNTQAYEMLKDHLVWGVGLNNFIPSLSHYTMIQSYQDLQPAHNIYLLFAAETGLTGIGIVLFFTYNMKIHKTPFLLPLIAIILLGLFDHYPSTIHQIQLFIAVLAGYTLSWKNAQKNS